MTAATIVLNWNGRGYLEGCLADLAAQDYPRHRVVVVDNGSEDGSQFWLRGAHPQVELLENHRNVGFAEGNNVGVRHLLADPEVRFIGFLNNDTRVGEDWLSKLIGALDRRPEFGAAQGPLVFAHEPELINSLGIAFERSLWAFDDGCFERDPARLEEAEVFGVTAGAAVMRREMVEDLLVDGSLFDPRFFAYYEDVDLALRARLRGWRSLLVPEAVVRHAASGTAGRVVHRKVYLLERNHWFYVIRNIPAATLLRRLPRFLWRRVTRMAQWRHPRQWRVLLWSARGNLAWIFWMPFLLRARRRTLSGANRKGLAAALSLRAGATERARA